MNQPVTTCIPQSSRLSVTFHLDCVASWLGVGLCPSPGETYSEDNSWCVVSKDLQCEISQVGWVLGWRKGRMKTLGLRGWSRSAFLADYSCKTVLSLGKSLGTVTHVLGQRRRNSFYGRGKKKKRLTPGSKEGKEWPLKFGECRGSADETLEHWGRLSASLGWSLAVICSKSLPLWASGNQFISKVPSASKTACCFFSH